MAKASRSKVVQEAKKKIEARIKSESAHYDRAVRDNASHLGFLNGLRESLKTIEDAEEGVLENGSD